MQQASVIMGFAVINIIVLAVFCLQFATAVTAMKAPLAGCEEQAVRGWMPFVFSFAAGALVNCLSASSSNGWDRARRDFVGKLQTSL